VPNFKDLTGQKFTRLTAHWPVGRKYGGKMFWLCSCECGTVRHFLGSHLSKGNSRSCGCLQREIISKTGAARLLPNGQSAFNALFGKYKVESERRGKSFFLTEDDFRKLITSNCHYCGRKPEQIYRMSGSRSTFIYNGIDCKDSTKGYGRGNSLPCCKICNFMKRQLSYDDFLKACFAVVNHKAIKVKKTA
jgi:hypothetical protein